MTAVTPYDRARAALAEAKTVDDVLEIIDQAAAIAEYRRRAEDPALLIDAIEIRMRAERRLGEMIGERKALIGFNRGGRPPETGSPQEPVLPTLAESGIDKKLSSKAQKMAALPPNKFEERLAAWRDQSAVADRVVTNLLHFGREEEQRQSRSDLAQALSDESHRLTGTRTFPCIYMDPAYSQKGGIGDRAYENHYPTEKWERIVEIVKLAAPRLQPNGWLFCWIPRAHMLALHEAKFTETIKRQITIDDGSLHEIEFQHEFTVNIPLAYAIARAIDPRIKFSTAFVWTKTDEDHPDEHGTFRICKDQDEILLMWKKGDGLPKPEPKAIFGSNHRERSRPLGHSRKPQFYREMIAAMTGGLPVLELFARVDEKFPLPPNWEAWGNESQNAASDDAEKRDISNSDGGVEGHAPEGTVAADASGMRERLPRDVEAAGSQGEAEAGLPAGMPRAMEQASDRMSQDSDPIAGPAASRGRDGVEPIPSGASFFLSDNSILDDIPFVASFNDDLIVKPLRRGKFR